MPSPKFEHKHKPQTVEICAAYPARAFLGTCEYKIGLNLKAALEAALQPECKFNFAAQNAHEEFNQLIGQALNGQLRVGVFGKLRELDDPLYAGDRVEIYRPLLVDPMESRRARAAKKAKA